MANKNTKEIRFKLNDDDYKEFGRYRILYTPGGRKIVNRQRITYLISGIMLAVLFTVFHVDPNFTKLIYAVAAVIGIGGVLFADKIILRQQSKIIDKEMSEAGRVHPEENVVTFEDDELITAAGEEVQRFSYSDIKQVDMTESAIYAWMSDTMIMPLPLHAFKGQKAMEDMYNWLQDKLAEAKNTAE
jgi:hypothetical protein